MRSVVHTRLRLFRPNAPGKSGMVRSTEFPSASVSSYQSRDHFVESTGSASLDLALGLATTGWPVFFTTTPASRSLAI